MVNMSRLSYHGVYVAAYESLPHRGAATAGSRLEAPRATNARSVPEVDAAVPFAKVH